MGVHSERQTRRQQSQSWRPNRCWSSGQVTRHRAEIAGLYGWSFRLRTPPRITGITAGMDGRHLMCEEQADKQ